jgi:hypothetical protein
MTTIRRLACLALGVVAAWLALGAPFNHGG